MFADNWKTVEATHAHMEEMQQQMDNMQQQVDNMQQLQLDAHCGSAATVERVAASAPAGAATVVAGGPGATAGATDGGEIEKR